LSFTKKDLRERSIGGSVELSVETSISIQKSMGLYKKRTKELNK